MTPESEPRRCDAHNLAVGRDGLCVVCRREQGRRVPAATTAGSLRNWWIAVTVLLALGAAGAVVHSLLFRDSGDSLGAAPTSTGEGGDRDAALTRDDNELVSGTGVSESTLEELRARRQKRERDRAEQHRLDAQKSARERDEAEREAREAARRAEREAEQQRRTFELAKRRVRITMYMADW